MALRLMSNGRAKVINSLIAQFLSGGNCTVCLFQGNITPSQTDLDSVYLTAEANFTGYSRVVINSWSAAAAVGTAAQTSGGSALFQCSTVVTVGNQIYGYFVVDSGTSPNQVMWAERFASAPLAMTTGGSAIVVVPVFNESSQFP